MIFDLSLSDEYIAQLEEEDLDELIHESDEFVYQTEGSIEELVGDMYPEGSVVSPGAVAWDPRLYPEEIEERPWMLQRLVDAEKLSSDIGRALAIRHTAYLEILRKQGILDG